MFIPLILSQGQNLSFKYWRYRAADHSISKPNKRFLENHHIDSSKILKASDISSKINFNIIPNFLNAILATISSFGMGLASVLFITFFFLKERNLFMTSAKKLIPDGHEDKALNSLEKSITYYHVTSLVYYYNYLLSLFYILRYYSIWCSQCIYNRFLMCAVLNIIPYIGPLIASVLAAVLTMLSNLGSDFQTEILPTTIYVLIGFG
jgi:predicted PurR-regulated permease PerM